MLPFDAEPLHVLQAKYPKAVKKVWDTSEIEKNPEDRPGKHRDHIFDFFDGFRLIVSREKVGMSTILHFSGSKFPTNDMKPPQFVEGMIRHIIELAGRLSGRLLVFATKDGIIHATYDERQKLQVGEPTSNPILN